MLEIRNGNPYNNGICMALSLHLVVKPWFLWLTSLLWWNLKWFVTSLVFIFNRIILWGLYISYPLDTFTHNICRIALCYHENMPTQIYCSSLLAVPKQIQVIICLFSLRFAIYMASFSTVAKALFVLWFFTDFQHIT